MLSPPWPAEPVEPGDGWIPVNVTFPCPVVWVVHCSGCCRVAPLPPCKPICKPTPHTYCSPVLATGPGPADRMAAFLRALQLFNMPEPLEAQVTEAVLRNQQPLNALVPPGMAGQLLAMYQELEGVIEQQTEQLARSGGRKPPKRTLRGMWDQMALLVEQINKLEAEASAIVDEAAMRSSRAGGLGGSDRPGDRRRRPPPRWNDDHSNHSSPGRRSRSGGWAPGDPQGHPQDQQQQQRRRRLPHGGPRSGSGGASPPPDASRDSWPLRLPSPPSSPPLGRLHAGSSQGVPQLEPADGGLKRRSSTGSRRFRSSVTEGPSDEAGRSKRRKSEGSKGSAAAESLQLPPPPEGGAANAAGNANGNANAAGNGTAISSAAPAGDAVNGALPDTSTAHERSFLAEPDASLANQPSHVPQHAAPDEAAPSIAADADPAESPKRKRIKSEMQGPEPSLDDRPQSTAAPPAGSQLRNRAEAVVWKPKPVATIAEQHSAGEAADMGAVTGSQRQRRQQAAPKRRGGRGGRNTPRSTVVSSGMEAGTYEAAAGGGGSGGPSASRYNPTGQAQRGAAAEPKAAGRGRRGQRQQVAGEGDLPRNVGVRGAFKPPPPSQAADAMAAPQQQKAGRPAFGTIYVPRHLR